MPTVAIAGGTSPSHGRSITIVILEQYRDGKWMPLILSRSANRPLWLQAVDPENRVKVVAVDYHSKQSITQAIKGAHTFLSVVLTKDATQAETMIRMLDAAVDAGVKRFVPSYWGVGVNAWEKGVWEACLEQECQGKISVARFNEGMHTNYFGIGAQKASSAVTDAEKLAEMSRNGGYAEGDDELCQGVDKEGDMDNGSFSISEWSAEIPMTSSGRYPLITMTTIRDVGRFVAAALDLEKWTHDMKIEGDTLTLNKILAMLGTIRRYDIREKRLSPQQIQEQINALQMPQDMMKGLWLELELMLTRDADDEGYLSGKVNMFCPQIKATSIREYLTMAWAR